MKRLPPNPWSFLALLLLTLIASCKKDEEIIPVYGVNDGKMRDLIAEISRKAKASNPDFLVIVQNAPAVAYDSGGIVNTAFLDVVDGFTVEEALFDCKGEFSHATSQLQSLDGLPNTEWKLVLDQVCPDDIAAFTQACIQYGAIGFPRSCKVDDYSIIPEKTLYPNTNDITQLSEVQNAIVFYSSKKYETKAEIIDSLTKRDFDVLIIDPGDKENPLTPTEVASLKTKTNGAKRLVIAYLNVGAAENWRYYFDEEWDHKKTRPDWFAGEYPGFSEEYKVKFWDPAWHEIMYSGNDSYIDRITAAGFDGVILDNVEFFDHNK